MGLSHEEYLRYRNLRDKSENLERVIKDLHKSKASCVRENDEIKRKLEKIDKYSNLNKDTLSSIMDDLSKDLYCDEFNEDEYERGGIISSNFIDEYKKTLHSQDKKRLKHLQDSLDYHADEFVRMDRKFKNLGFDFMKTTGYEETKKEIIEEIPHYYKMDRDELRENELLIDNFTEYIIKK